MKRKPIIFLLSFISAFCLTACKNESTSSPSTSDSSSSSSVPSQTNEWVEWKNDYDDFSSFSSFFNELQRRGTVRIVTLDLTGKAYEKNNYSFKGNGLINLSTGEILMREEEYSFTFAFEKTLPCEYTNGHKYTINGESYPLYQTEKLTLSELSFEPAKLITGGFINEYVIKYENETLMTININAPNLNAENRLTILEEIKNGLISL